MSPGCLDGSLGSKVITWKRVLDQAVPVSLFSDVFSFRDFGLHSELVLPETMPTTSMGSQLELSPIRAQDMLMKSSGGRVSRP